MFWCKKTKYKNCLIFLSVSLDFLEKENDEQRQKSHEQKSQREREREIWRAELLTTVSAQYDRCTAARPPRSVCSLDIALKFHCDADNDEIVCVHAGWLCWSFIVIKFSANELDTFDGLYYTTLQPKMGLTLSLHIETWIV